MINLADANMSPAFFIHFVSFMTGLQHSPSVDSLYSLIEENQLKNMEELATFLSFMVRFQDDTRINVSDMEMVHLITNHESKGREFKAVIMIDDLSSDITEENRRLFYVGMTRAKDFLYIFYEETKESFVKELGKEKK